jgi:hypothetical protein
MKMECPFCIKDLQARAMFGHIRKFHNDELLKSTSRRWITEAETGEPLRVFWSKKNDFDEDEDTVLYVCLASNKTFVSEHKANEHFAKDKTAKKEHNKQLKQLKKEYDTMKKLQAKKAKQRPESAFDIALRTNDPELARAIWRGILHHRKVNQCSMMICRRRGYSESTPMYLYNNKENRYTDTYFPTFVEAYEKLMNQVDELKDNECLETKVLLDLYFALWNFWDQNFRESLFEFRESILEAFPLYNHGVNGDDKFYGFATDEMEAVNF